MAPPPATASPGHDCQEPHPTEPEALCAAAVAAHRRCLAHLTREQRTAYLATLAPGSDVYARGVNFTTELLAELLAALRDKKDIVQAGNADFREATFSGEADFNRAAFWGKADFDKATFSGDANFFEAIFYGATNFNLATFSGEAHFSKAKFSMPAVFHEVTFSRVTYFFGARFSKSANFIGAKFCAGANFLEANFRGDTIFIMARFQSADFALIGFSGKAQFSRTTFSGEVRFSKATFYKEASFIGATFSKHARFDDVTFLGGSQFLCRADSIYFDRAVVEEEMSIQAAADVVSAVAMRAQGRVSLRLRAARLNLADAAFTGPVTIHGLHQPIPYVDESGIADPVTGVVPAVAVVSLRGLDAESLVLTDVDLRSCLFTEMRRIDQLSLDGQCPFSTDPRGRRQVLAEEHHWRATRRPRLRRRRGSTGRWTPAPDRVEIVGPARLEALYRQLRKAFEDGKNEPGATDFYYGEMEMRRNASGPWRERVLLSLYWLLSGYGLRGSRALISLAVVVALLAIGMKYAGFPGRHHPAYLDTLLYSLRATFSVDVKTTALPENVTRWGQVIRIVLRIVGPLFVGLAALAIRNRVKR